jgi:hypothetical protein
MSMTLLQLFKDLTYGELSQLSIGSLIPEESESEPDPRDYENILSHLNLGLRELYKRFFLLSKEINIQQEEEIETYVLSSRYAETNAASTEPIKYIKDTVDDPFRDDVLKIEEVYDEGGNKLPLNDITEPLSVYTPSFQSVQIPYPLEENMFSVQYRACHPRVEYTPDMDPATIEIMVPNSLYEALLYYIAARVQSSMGGDQGQEGNDFFQKFENSCKMVELHGLEIQGEPGIWRFDQAGWV